jgi:hypothetical protein
MIFRCRHVRPDRGDVCPGKIVELAEAETLLNPLHLHQALISRSASRPGYQAGQDRVREIPSPAKPPAACSTRCPTPKILLGRAAAAGAGRTEHFASCHLPKSALQDRGNCVSQSSRYLSFC